MELAAQHFTLTVEKDKRGKRKIGGKLCQGREYFVILGENYINTRFEEC